MPPTRRPLRTLQHGEFNIHGWRRTDLVARLDIAPSAMSRQLERLHPLGLIKKVSHTCRYYLAQMGRADRRRLARSRDSSAGALHPFVELRAGSQ